MKTEVTEKKKITCIGLYNPEKKKLNFNTCYATQHNRQWSAYYTQSAFKRTV